jgi:hypothetical protein
MKKDKITTETPNAETPQAVRPPQAETPKLGVSTKPVWKSEIGRWFFRGSYFLSEEEALTSVETPEL